MSTTPRRPPLVIGLLGGIAAGKSTVARAFAQHGFVLIDADALAQRALSAPPVLDSIRATFGPGVFQGEQLDRQRLADLVFADRKAKVALERLVHPLVRDQILEMLRQAKAKGASVVLDVPLLLETGMDLVCDACVFVDSNLANRSLRAAQRGWSTTELARRETQQTELSQKRARCAYTIANDGLPQDVHEQVAKLLHSLWSSTS